MELIISPSYMIIGASKQEY